MPTAPAPLKPGTEVSKVTKLAKEIYSICPIIKSKQWVTGNKQPQSSLKRYGRKLFLNKNLVQEIMRSKSKNYDLQDIFVLAMTCTQIYTFFEDYCKSLPELLTELSKKIIDSDEKVTDGYFNFKRLQNERIIVYRLWCTNLNFKKLNLIQHH